MDYNKKLCERIGFKRIPPKPCPTVILQPALDDAGNPIVTPVEVEHVPVDYRNISLRALKDAGVNIELSSAVNSSLGASRLDKEMTAQSFLSNLPVADAQTSTEE